MDNEYQFLFYFFPLRWNLHMLVGLNNLPSLILLNSWEYGPMCSLLRHKKCWRDGFSVKHLLGKHEN